MLGHALCHALCHTLCFHLQTIPHSISNNAIDKEYNQSYYQNNQSYSKTIQSYYQNNQSYSKTIQSYQSYNPTLTEVLKELLLRPKNPGTRNARLSLLVRKFTTEIKKILDINSTFEFYLFYQRILPFNFCFMMFVQSVLNFLQL